MKKIALTFLLLFAAPNLSFANSLDEIYRDLIKSDNEGYLPVFIKNRDVPDFLDEEEVAKQTTVKEKDRAEFDGPVGLNNQRKLRDEETKKEIEAWKTAIEAIQHNQVTPVELQEVEKRVSQKDPKATEIYAWMLARGVGINQDLNKALEMYQRAHIFKVPNALENAALVYKDMTPEQRSEVKPFDPATLIQPLP